jgi:hypothetical protein
MKMILYVLILVHTQLYYASADNIDLQVDPSTASTTFIGRQSELKDEHYGVDVSFPIHHSIDKKSYFGQKYSEYIQGCYDKYSKRECDANDRARMDMNYDQPRSQHNYTDMGFKKIRAPDSVMKPILKFYEKYKGQDVPEKWPRGNVYVNHWDSPTTMISFENKNFRGGFDVKQEIWDAVKPVLEEWTHKKLVATSLYGIRFYHDGAVLSPRKLAHSSFITSTHNTWFYYRCGSIAVSILSNNSS